MRLHRWILIVASRLVPRASREDWRAEWEAELHYRESSSAPWRKGLRSRLDLIRRSSGAFWDALWLQASRWYSLRLFGRHWRLALTATMSLTIAIAATVMGMAAYNALLLRPPAVADPGSLRFIHIRTAAEPFGGASFPEYVTYRDETRAFSDIAAYPYSISSIPLVAGDRTQQVVATQVSDNYFTLLGVPPRAGLVTFRSSAGRQTFDVVLSEKLWRALGANPRIAGATIRLNDQPVTVAGVAADTFSGMTWGFEPEVWMSFDASARVLGSPPGQLTDRTQRWLHLIGRLGPGVTDALASSEVQIIAASIARDYPDTGKDHTSALTAATITPPGERRWTALILGSLLLIVLLTLVVACANVTNLLLGLASSRRHEMLVRAALGATRLQLVVPLMREAIVLGAISGALGYGIAWLLLAQLATLKPSFGAFFPALSLDLRPDVAVLTATIAIAFLASLAVGLPPALRGAADGLSGAINRQRTIGEPHNTHLRHALVVMQMAIATLVLAGVGLSMHSLYNLRHVSLGFTARNLAYVGVDVERSGHNERTAPAFLERIREHVQATAGVDALTLASDAPLTGYSRDRVIVDGAPPPGGDGTDTPYLTVDDRYFATLGITLQAGRTFDSRDRAGRTEVAVVNQAFARRHFSDRSPLGHRLQFASDRRVAEIIGVVSDGKYSEIDEDQLPMVYVALAQRFVPMVTVIARTNGPRDSIATVLAKAEPNIVFGGVGPIMTLGDVLGLSLALPLTIVWTTIGFGVVALALAVFGLYSTVFYAVSQQRMEIGVRAALGASPSDLFRLALRQIAGVAAAGALVGFGGGLLLTPVASAIFYGVRPIETWVMVGVALTMGGIVLVTTYSVVRPWTRMAALDLLRR